MAADVAAWHRAAGGRLDPDTLSGKRAVPLPDEQGPVRVYYDPHGFVVGGEGEGEA